MTRRRRSSARTGNVGITYFETGKFDEALKFLHVAVHEFRTLGMTPELGRALAYLAVTYQAKGDAQRSIETYEFHLRFCRSIDELFDRWQFIRESQ